MKVVLLASALVLSGCATTRVCQTADQEPVSICRAEAECEPSAGQRFAAGYSKQLPTLMANRNMCVMNNIEAQKANAALRMMSGAKD